jgi:hypothetical protein
MDDGEEGDVLIVCIKGRLVAPNTLPAHVKRGTEMGW